MFRLPQPSVFMNSAASDWFKMVGNDCFYTAPATVFPIGIPSRKLGVSVKFCIYAAKLITGRRDS